MQVTTNVKYAVSGGTFIVCITCCFFGCGLCALIPFFINATKAARHTCPQCSAPIGEKAFLL
jgi:hypothetical protein